MTTEIAEHHGLTVVRTFEEQRSAMEPYQRPIFDSMIRALQRGRANSILCYHVNRLARNMVEGGLLQHLLTKGIIKEIRTYNETFRSGDNILRFILEAAMSAQFSIDLSQTVTLHMEAKVKRGDYPSLAPQGYVNNLRERTVEVDPERFVMVGRALELMATGSYSVDDLARLMNEKWGYRTRKTPRSGGAKISKSVLHHILRNVFYTGHFLYRGELHRGNHPAMISFETFNRIQQVLDHRGRPRKQKHDFAYTGLIACARCSRQVTAEMQPGRLRRGSYVYYHCSRPRRCGSRAAREKEIESVIVRYLKSVAVDPEFRDLGVAVIERCYRDEIDSDSVDYAQQTQALNGAERQLARARHMALKELLTDEEFASERRRLQSEINTLKSGALTMRERLDRAKDGAIEVIEFATKEPSRFAISTPERKREIARRLGVDYALLDGQLLMELHPLLRPIYTVREAHFTKVIEPPKVTNLSTKNGQTAVRVLHGMPDRT